MFGKTSRFIYFYNFQLTWTLFPPEICLELLEVEEVNENEEFWQDILSPYPERDETLTESDMNQLSQEGDGLSSKNDLCPIGALFSTIPEELFCSHRC